MPVSPVITTESSVRARRSRIAKSSRITGVIPRSAPKLGVAARGTARAPSSVTRTVVDPTVSSAPEGTVPRSRLTAPARVPLRLPRSTTPTPRAPGWSST